MSRTHSCAPTMTDEDVVWFCRNGYWILEAAVPDEINRRALDYLASNTHGEPTEIMAEDCFVDGVILNPAAAGRCARCWETTSPCPTLMANHRGRGPAQAARLHRDSGSLHGPELNYLQVFYYPQDVPAEMGRRSCCRDRTSSTNRKSTWRTTGRSRGGVLTTGTARSQSSLPHTTFRHRRAARTAPAAAGVRHLLKYNYWRHVDPRRDLDREPGVRRRPSADFVVDGLRFADGVRDCVDDRRNVFLAQRQD